MTVVVIVVVVAIVVGGDGGVQFLPMLQVSWNSVSFGLGILSNTEFPSNGKKIKTLYFNVNTVDSYSSCIPYKPSSTKVNR